MANMLPIRLHAPKPLRMRFDVEETAQPPEVEFLTNDGEVITVESIPVFIVNPTE